MENDRDVILENIVDNIDNMVVLLSSVADEMEVQYIESEDSIKTNQLYQLMKAVAAVRASVEFKNMENVYESISYLEY